MPGDANTPTGYDVPSCERQYGNSKIGKTAANSGHYNTFRVPFGAKGVRVTLQAPRAFRGHCDDSCAVNPGPSTRLTHGVIQKGTRVLISLWDSLMFGRVPKNGAPPF